LDAGTGGGVSEEERITQRRRGRRRRGDFNTEGTELGERKEFTAEIAEGRRVSVGLGNL
jgi:hypothetical protein